MERTIIRVWSGAPYAKAFADGVVWGLLSLHPDDTDAIEALKYHPACAEHLLAGELEVYDCLLERVCRIAHIELQMIDQVPAEVAQQPDRWCEIMWPDRSKEDQ